MIVRTYGRRNRCISGTYSDSGYDADDSFRDSLSQESSQDIYNFNFSSQDSSSPWSFDSDIYGSNSSQAPPPPPPVADSSSQDGSCRVAPKAKRQRNLPPRDGGRNGKSVVLKGDNRLGSVAATAAAAMAATSTLMEAQEFGEMMEHVDEVNFALDGLRKGQPTRIRRASLLSLLSISATAAQRRLLRTQGMAKTILDAILGLSLDDSPSTLAAAALFYILASDGQDEHLLESPICICFLLKLLGPSLPTSIDDKAPAIGSKLLALCRDAGRLVDQTKGSDASSTAIVAKVQEILLNCKEIQSIHSDEQGMERPELSPKWIALLTIEKACVSTVSLEDTSGTVRRVGGNFKEKLRELGGLDAVFKVALDCHSVMKGWSERILPQVRKMKDDVSLKTLVLLLKCLKIMENATFLSKDNQDHLLGVNRKLDAKGPPLSFTSLVISVIKILSGLSLLQSSSLSNDERSPCQYDGIDYALKNPLKENHGVEHHWLLSNNSSRSYCSLEENPVDNSEGSQKCEMLSSSPSICVLSSSKTSFAFTHDGCSLRKECGSSTSGSCNGPSRSSHNGKPRSTSNLKMTLGLGKRPRVPQNSKCMVIEDSQDPFAFDEYETEPSKWDTLSRSKQVSRTQECRIKVRELQDDCQLMMSHQEPSNGDGSRSCEIASSPAVEEENSGLVADCLLTAVKVLMNLTNDNPVGCKQIAACGGLETLSSLIIGHFPSFSTLSPSNQFEDGNLLSQSGKDECQNDKHFTEQELDFLVAILGLLVNLVEKDSVNRSRLAAASVSLPSSGGSEGTTCQRDVIPLLCSIFLANQGSGEMGGEAMSSPSSWDDEDVVLQGEREAEKMIIEAYAALLLAFLSTESKDVRESIARYLPNHNLEVLVPVLERFVAFHLTLNMISPETHSAVSEVIESCRGT